MLFLSRYIPLDSHLQFHKICALTALFFSMLHTVGHLVNFYHVSTQPVEHLNCLSKELNFPSDGKPSVDYWLFQVRQNKKNFPFLLKDHE